MKPFCIATIGTIIGIIMGLYFKGIAFFVLLCTLTILLVILIHFLTPKYQKNVLICCFCITAFYLYTFITNENYAQINKEYNNQEVQIKAIVISDKVEKEYKDVYEIEVLESKLEKSKDNKNKAKNFKMLLNVKRDKNRPITLEYGDKISYTAIYEEPSTSRNEGGFDYAQYLKTKKVVGINSVKSSEIEINAKNQIKGVNKIIYDIKNKAIKNVKSNLPEDNANLCTSLLLGEKSELSEEIQEDFRKSNLSHMLAISGAHVSYILLGLSSIVEKLKLHKRWGKVPLILFLIFFMALVGFTPSVTRACIMTIMQLLAGILFKNSDTYQNLAISSFIILLANPYALLDIGFQLSFGGTIGIIVFSKNISNIRIKRKYTIEDRKEQGTNKNNTKKILIILKKVINVVKEMCIVTVSANLLIIPIMMYHFNTISLTFIISNLLASHILGVSLIFSMIFLVASFICNPIAKLISFLLHPTLQLLIIIANFSGKLPLSQILVPTPKIWQIIVYYIILYIVFLKKAVTKSKKSNSDKNQIDTTKTALSVTKSCITKLHHKKIILTILILIIIFPYLINLIPTNKLTINFIDVGQGDSMLIQTPYHKTILIDGGGSERGSFDVGEKTLLPYLLDKGIMQIDYMIFSHMDSDHCLRIIYNYGEIKGEKCDY